MNKQAVPIIVVHNDKELAQAKLIEAGIDCNQVILINPEDKELWDQIKDYEVIPVPPEKTFDIRDIPLIENKRINYLEPLKKTNYKRPYKFHK